MHTRNRGSRWISGARYIRFAASAAILAAFAIPAAAHESVRWTANGSPNTVAITGGPWTLEQSGAANGLKSSAYCTSNDNGATGTEVPNPGTERMQPYYFPYVVGQGDNLQGYFDWRPKDTDEAVVSASSSDGGKTWTFQDKVLELTTACPTNKNTLGDLTTKNAVCLGTVSPFLPCENASNDQTGGVADDGQGHSFVMTIKGQTLLYTLNRSNGHIDSDPLVIHVLSPTPGHPLAGAPLLDDGPTDAMPGLPEPPLHTTGQIVWRNTQPFRNSAA